jgi:hypothetical protein
MRILIAGLLLLGLAPAAHAEEIVSVYTDIDVQKNCTTFDINVEGGEFANFACNGYGGHPVLIYSADLRESLYYGFPRTDEHVWESFSAFNSTGPKIEWRVSKDGDRTIPFATIHRWFVSDPEDAEKTTEVLVVAKVGLVKERDGCAVGLVLASGNPQANDTARKIADEQARDFACGADERVLVGDNLPSFDRQQN